MIREALEFLADLKAGAQAPHPLPSDPRTARFLVGGQPLEIDLPTPPRRHRPKTLDEVIALAARFAGSGLEPVVWYDEEQVVLVIDDAGHRVETATLTLEVSDTFAVMRMLREKKPWFSQPDFIMLLRVDLAGTLDPAVLLAKVRRLEVGQKSTSEVRRGGESMGIAINALAGKDGMPPDEVELVLPVYKTPGEQVPAYLSCTVDFEVARPAPFRLLPKPDEVERVLQVAVGAIGGRLRAGLPEGVVCYHGRA